MNKTYVLQRNETDTGILAEFFKKAGVMKGIDILNLP